MQLPRFLSRSIRLAAVLLMLVSPALAQETPADDTARFLIQTITVETDREASASIIKAETLLKEGETYTEEDLRQAIARVHRLPFVLDASFSLRKGSERGTYELVVEAHTARLFFFDRGLQLTRFDRAYALEGNFFSGSHSAVSQVGLIGGRLFTGRSGVLYSSVGFHQDVVSDGLGIEAGYTQYDLFGRGVVADASYSANYCCTTEVLPFGLSPSLQVWDWDRDQRTALNLAIPLSRNRSLQLGWSERWGEAGDHRRILFDDSLPYIQDSVFDGDQRSRQVAARWVQDTSDDPLLPSRGSVLSAGLEYVSYSTDKLQAYHYDFPSPNPPVVFLLPEFHGEMLTAAVAATRHWSLTPRQSVSATARLSYGRSRVTYVDNGRSFGALELDVYGGSVGGKHLLRLWSLREPGNVGDLYLETEARYGLETAPLPEGFSYGLGRLELSTGLTFRNRWGRLRLAFSYLDLGEVKQ